MFITVSIRQMSSATSMFALVFFMMPVNRHISNYRSENLDKFSVRNFRLLLLTAIINLNSSRFQKNTTIKIFGVFKKCPLGNQFPCFMSFQLLNCNFPLTFELMYKVFTCKTLGTIFIVHIHVFAIKYFRYVENISDFPGLIIFKSLKCMLKLLKLKKIVKIIFCFLQAIQFL